MTLRQARIEDLDDVRAIFREYAEWVGSEICFQSFERELAELPGRYAPPEGGLYLAETGGQIAGCAAFRRLTPEVAEMKRLFVRPQFRGEGLGRLLALRIIQEARDAGYSRLCLDTLPRMERAIGMYQALGFQQMAPYGDNPPSALCFDLLL